MRFVHCMHLTGDSLKQTEPYHTKYMHRGITIKHCDIVYLWVLVPQQVSSLEKNSKWWRGRPTYISLQNVFRKGSWNITHQHCVTGYLLILFGCALRPLQSIFWTTHCTVKFYVLLGRKQIIVWTNSNSWGMWTWINLIELIITNTIL